ncbi:efflux RND transporter periplasmic adaptor subunit [Cryomorphaceae bacterium]|nr:efflux RND transporter periplasmic adaptor subunit [Cryomorphaceae bacterium]
MKKFILLTVVAAVVAACGTTPTEDTSDLGQLRAEKDSLIVLSQKVLDEISVLDEKISSLDTNAKRALVSILPVSQQNFEHYFSVHGVVRANKNVTLYAESAGNVTGMNVKEGQRVSAGQVLVELDAEVMKSQLKEVETNLALAIDLYERQKRLWDQKIGSEVDYLNAKNRKEALEQSKATLERQIQMAQIIAPFSGVIDEVFPRKGEYVGPSSPVVRLINLDQTYLESDVSEYYVSKVKAGTPVLIEFPSLDTTLEAKITRTGNYINPNNRTFKLEVNLTNVRGIELKPNLLAVVNVMDYNDEEALVLPARTIQQTPTGESFVYVVSQGTGVAKVRKQMITTGFTYQNMTEITEGLKATDFIVDKGARSIREGQDVRIAANTL